MNVVAIEGTVTVETSHGPVKVNFSLSRDYSWQQWGQAEDVLYATLPVVEVMQDAA